jgi:hypothetical protein
MPSAIAQTAHFCLAATTLPVLLPVFLVYVLGLDPFPASSCWTIYTIFGGKLLEFPIPSSLKIVIKQLLDMLQWYVISRAAFWRHMLGISNRKLEDSLETRATHAMSTPKLCSFGSWDLVQTCQALNPTSALVENRIR